MLQASQRRRSVTGQRQAAMEQRTVALLLADFCHRYNHIDVWFPAAGRRV
jgi:hypothetical protein